MGAGGTTAGAALGTGGLAGGLGTDIGAGFDRWVMEGSVGSCVGSEGGLGISGRSLSELNDVKGEELSLNSTWVCSKRDSMSDCGGSD
jgi:hypothetical protein